MDDQAIDRHIDRHPVFSGLTQSLADGDCDVADMFSFLGGVEIVRPLAGKTLGRRRPGGKREDIRRLVDVSKLPVQLAHRAVAHDGDVDVPGDGRITGRPDFTQDCRRPPAQPREVDARLPLPVCDGYPHCFLSARTMIFQGR